MPVMSDPLISLPPSAFEAFDAPSQDRLANDKSPFPLDFFSFASPSDILAPHPDLFESELDSTFAQFDDSDLHLQLLTVDSNDAFSFLRSDTPTHQYRSTGPPSTITVSSESASGYDSLSSYSESFYNNSQSPELPSNYSFPLDLDLDMEFQRVQLDTLANYAPIKRSPAVGTHELAAALRDDRASFGALPPTPPHHHASPPMGHAADMYRHRSRAYSDYVPSQPVLRTSASSDYYPQMGHARHPSLLDMQPRTVSPSRVSPSASSDMSNMSVPITPPLPLVSNNSDSADEDNGQDSRRKYKCANCPRSFARAFNLKTHMATHDPNRPKPHVCPHKSCGRSFSRKHDLGRHLVSIHRDEHGMANAGTGIIAGQQARSERGLAVGVEKGPRGWCESCGKGWVGRDRGCNCNDVK